MSRIYRTAVRPVRGLVLLFAALVVAAFPLSFHNSASARGTATTADTETGADDLFTLVS